MTIGENIRHAREKQGLSQNALARFTGLTQAAISYIEVGRYNPTPETLKLIADALDVKVFELVADTADMKEWAMKDSIRLVELVYKCGMEIRTPCGTVTIPSGLDASVQVINGKIVLSIDK